MPRRLKAKQDSSGSVAPSENTVRGVGPPEQAQHREPRGERRKRETRDRLLDAAFRLMAERGKDAIAIHQITEEADVALGSFYNHFASKEAIYLAVITQMFEEFGRALDELTLDVEDAAEVIAICVRHTIRRAQSEPLWGQLLVREAQTGATLSRGLGVRFLRDIRRGCERGRLIVREPVVTVLAVGGAVLSAVSAGALLTLHGTAEQPLRGLLDADTLAARMAVEVLTLLGLPRGEAEEIAARPLPSVPR